MQESNKKIVRIAVYIALIAAALIIGLAIGGFFQKSSDDGKTRIAGVLYNPPTCQQRTFMIK